MRGTLFFVPGIGAPVLSRQKSIFEIVERAIENCCRGLTPFVSIQRTNKENGMNVARIPVRRAGILRYTLHLNPA
jgi:hypothetical protein